MGVYEWVLMGVTYAVILAVFFTALALEVKKNIKLKGQITQEILRAKMRLWARIFFLALGVLTWLGSTATIICCTLLIEPAPKFVYAVVMLMIVFVEFLCGYGFLASYYNVVYATEEGVWVSRVFMKSAFYRYEEVASILDTTYSLYGGYTVFKRGGKKMFTVSHKREKNARELIELIKSRSPALKRWDSNDVFGL